MCLENRAVRQVRVSCERCGRIARSRVLATEDEHVAEADHGLDVVVRVAAACRIDRVEVRITLDSMSVRRIVDCVRVDTVVLYCDSCSSSA